MDAHVSVIDPSSSSEFCALPKSVFHVWTKTVVSWQAACVTTLLESPQGTCNNDHQERSTGSWLQELILNSMMGENVEETNTWTGIKQT